jgi:transcriptional antiterminator
MDITRKCPHCQKVYFVIEEKLMNYLISLMVEDVEREAKGEIISNKQTRKAISQRTAKLIIEHLKSKINEN